MTKIGDWSFFTIGVVVMMNVPTARNLEDHCEYENDAFVLSEQAKRAGGRSREFRVRLAFSISKRFSAHVPHLMSILERRLASVLTRYDAQDQPYDTENGCDSTLGDPMREYPGEKAAVREGARLGGGGFSAILFRILSQTRPETQQAVAGAHSPTVSPQQHCERCSDPPGNQHEHRVSYYQFFRPLTT